MMFETLSEKLQGIFRELGRKGKLRESDIESGLREVRLALLEADVHYQVVKTMLDRVHARALGSEVSRALDPAQQVVKILHQELVSELGEPGRLRMTGPTPRALMLVGLQGSGKTTAAAKLARVLKQRGERVWMVAADTYRPAAAEQLTILGHQVDVPVYSESGEDPVERCRAGVEAADRAGATVAILDTAGRSQIDEPLMDELRAIRHLIKPAEIILVADAMTGQEAVNFASGFHEALQLTGLILSKMDGDARGGAAISMRAVTGVPLKFIGTGEGLEALEAFEPDRLASRILGMGDVLSLIEKAEAGIEREQAGRQASRLMGGEFTLEDFADQLAQVRQMGPLGKILELLPGGMRLPTSGVDGDLAERQLGRTQAILRSMTPVERRKPEILNGSRKRRIASGSGTTVQEVNQLLRQFQQMRRIFKQVGKRGMAALPPGLR
ncbi:MAG: signal recognition particle protein [Chloroflexi bacterium RBG_19FT_COMBO_62_14]|nr:MAG: signal recognition particle protein [Chloroflexi bacterium RBG_19FT_COMBO_62_14]